MYVNKECCYVDHTSMFDDSNTSTNLLHLVINKNCIHIFIMFLLLTWN